MKGLRLTPTRIEGCSIVHFENRVDERGLFQEAFRDEDFFCAGLPASFQQDNVSVSFRRVMRGLHLQRNRPQGKLVRVFGGAIYDVCLDLRKDSPTFGEWEGINLSWERPLGFYVPPGCAHGFVVTAEAAMVYYKCTTGYDAETDEGVNPLDPALKIAWPPLEGGYILSERDTKLPTLSDYLKQRG